MRITWQQARCFTAALMATACLNSGCGTTAGHHTGPPTASSGPMPEGSPTLELNAGQERRAAAAAHFAAGMALGMSKGFEASLSEYSKAIALDPDSAPLALHVAQVYLNRRDFTNAIAVLDSASKANPTDANLWFGLGIAYRNADQPDRAILACRQAVKIEPTHVNALRLLLDALAEKDPPGDIAAVIGPALKQTSTDSGYWLTLGDTLGALLRQKPSLASQIDRTAIRQCYEKALELSPQDWEIQARVADAYVDSGEFALAADAYSKLLQARPDNQQILDRLWRIYIRSDQKDKAIGTLEELIKRDPLRFEVYNTLGDLYEELDKTDKAIVNYQQSLVLNPNQLELFVRIALAQLRVKKFDDAAQTLATAKNKFPTKYQVPYLVGLLQSDEKNYTNAVASFADAELLAKEDPEEIKPTSAFYFAYGSACERIGDADKAAAMFRKAIDLDPNNHNAYNYLGYMWADKGVHLEESLALIQKALKLEPENGAYLDSLGWVLYRLGRLEEALPHLRRAAELLQTDEKQEDATVLDHLAEVLLKLGNREEAVEALRRATKVDPDNKDLAAKLQKYSANHVAPK